MSSSPTRSRRDTPPEVVGTRTAASVLPLAPPVGGLGRGVRWAGSTQVATQVLSVLTMVALARILSPGDFGLVSLVTVITAFFERVLGDTGTTTALVRHRDLTHGLASSVFYWNLLVGGLTTTAFLVFAEPLAALLGDPAAASVVRVLGCMSVISATMYVQTALFRRNLQFGRLAAVNTINVGVTMALTIVMALAGCGVWSLTVGNVLGSATAAVAAWLWSDWRPGRYFSRHELSSISGFSTRLSVQRLFAYFSYAGDRLVIGRMIGVTELGYYGMANRLLRYPLQASAQTYREAVFPTLARLQDDDDAISETYRRSLAAIALVLLPVCATLAAVADPLVRVVLGPQWIPAIPLVGIIAVVGALQALATTTGSLYLVKGRADLSLRWNIGSSMALMACYLVGSRWGARGVAWGYLTGIAVLTYPAFRIPLRLIDVRPRYLARAVLPALACAVGGALAAAGAVMLARRAGAIPAARLAAGLVASAMVNATIVAVLRPQAFDDLVRIVPVGVRRRMQRQAGGTALDHGSVS